MSTPPLESVPFLPSLVPSVLLPLALAPAILRLCLQPPAFPIHLTSAGIIGIMLTRLRSVVHHVLVGKPEDRQVDAFSLPAGSTISSLVYLQDKLSYRLFLIEFWPLSQFSRRQPLHLHASNCFFL